MKTEKQSAQLKAGVSLDPDDAEVGGGLFGAGPAVAQEHVWGKFDYNKTRKPVTALLVTFERDGETYIESYTVGAGWKASPDGKVLIPIAGQSALKDSCKAMLYFKSLKDDCDMPKGFINQGVDALDGIEGELTRKPMDIDRSRDKKKKKGDDDDDGNDRTPTVLVFTELESAPWIEGSGKKKKKTKPVVEDDEDETEAEEEEEEEEERPAKGKKKPAPPVKGKKKPAADDDDEEAEADEDEAEADADDEDLLEEGIEALIAALDDGPIKTAAVEASVLGVLKKHPKRKAIAALMATPKVLKQERGWELSANGKTISLGD